MELITIHDLALALGRSESRVRAVMKKPGAPKCVVKATPTPTGMAPALYNKDKAIAFFHDQRYRRDL